MFRPFIVGGFILTLVVGLAFLHLYHLPLVPSKVLAPAASRLSRLETNCRLPDPFEVEYGRTNLRMTRAYEGERLLAPAATDDAGSRHRLQKLLRKTLRGEPVTISAIGGSGEL